MNSPSWTLDAIRSHVAEHLPVAALLGIEIVAASQAQARVRMRADARLLRPGGSVAGPVLFAMADVATYALTLALRQQDEDVTTSLQINFLRPALASPLIAEAVPLRAGRTLLTYDVRIWSESQGPGKPLAQAIATWAAGKPKGAAG